MLYIYSMSNLKIQTFSICLLLVGTISCDNSLEPVDNNGIIAFYGALDLDKETNFIRVRDLNAPFTTEATRELNFEVTLKNLDDGSLETLGQRRREYEGLYQYNYVVNQPIAPDTRYKFKVTRPDGHFVSKTILSPTYPVPVAEPVNQDCYTPIQVSFDPVNGSSFTYKIGFSLSGSIYWGARQYLLSADSTTTSLSLTFIPVDELKLVPFTRAMLRCTDLVSEYFYLSYAHYSKGFAESIFIEEFDIFESTQRLGAYYEDTLAIPIDTSRVCPPDC